MFGPRGDVDCMSKDRIVGGDEATHVLAFELFMSSLPYIREEGTAKLLCYQYVAVT